MSLGKIFKALVWLTVHIIVYVLLTWVFLGIGPKETYHKFIQQMNAYRSGAFTFSSDFATTTSKFGRVANHHLNEASERIDGIDPYDRHNSQLDQKVRQDFGR